MFPKLGKRYYKQKARFSFCKKKEADGRNSTSWSTGLAWHEKSCKGLQIHAKNEGEERKHEPD